MKTQIVYKAVKFFNEQTGYLSAFNSIFRCRYRIGKATTNKKMPLFAFDTLENARAFSYDNFNAFIIFKCNAVVSPMQPKLRAFTYDVDFILFWKQIRNKKKITAFTSQKVKGTIFCSSITLLEIVK